MHVELYQTPDRQLTLDLADNKPVPDIYIDEEEVEQRTGMNSGADVTRIHVIGENGKTAKFWLDVKINKQGRPILVAATNVGDKTNVKKLTGQWRD